MKYSILAFQGRITRRNWYLDEFWGILGKFVRLQDSFVIFCSFFCYFFIHVCDFCDVFVIFLVFM